MVRVKERETYTILWVRWCETCRSIDRRHWLETDDDADSVEWRCPSCEGTAFRLFKTRW